jgi:hypothetical protein
MTERSRLYELAHVVDFHLHSITNPLDRQKFLAFLDAGWPNGQYAERTADVQCQLRCLDCEFKDNTCPEECPVTWFKVGQAVPDGDRNATKRRNHA